MLRYLNKTGLLELGFKKLGVREGKTIYKRIVPKLDINDGMSFFPSHTRARQVTEFAYLDEATDKVVKTATRRVGEYGDSAKALNRSTKTEFTKANINGYNVDTNFAHYTDSQPVHYYPVEGKMPGTYFVAEHHYPNVGTEVGRSTDFVTFNTLGDITQRGRVRVPQLSEETQNGLKRVWTYERGPGHKPGQIQSSYVSHEITPQGRYLRTVDGTGTIYTPEAQVGVPKYTSLTDLKTNNQFYTEA